MRLWIVPIKPFVTHVHGVGIVQQQATGKVNHFVHAQFKTTLTMHYASYRSPRGTGRVKV